jgi:hypothetical protein
VPAHKRACLHVHRCASARISLHLCTICAPSPGSRHMCTITWIQTHMHHHLDPDTCAPSPGSRHMCTITWIQTHRFYPCRIVQCKVGYHSGLLFLCLTPLATNPSPICAHPCHSGLSHGSTLPHNHKLIIRQPRMKHADMHVHKWGQPAGRRTLHDSTRALCANVARVK